MLKKYLSVIITLFVLLPLSAESANIFAPPIPARIGGTATVDGVQLNQTTDIGYTFKVTKQDGSDYVDLNGDSAQDTDGLNAFDWYLIDIPIYDATDQPGGANPGDTAVIHVYKDGTELKIIYPADGQFTVGVSGSPTQINLEIMTNQLYGVIDLPEEDPVMITAGDSVEFAGTGYGDPELNYLWNFGDPDIPVSNQQNPGSVQFNTPGTYTVMFTVCNSNGCDPAPDTRTIIVDCHDPLPQENLSVCDFCSEETTSGDYSDHRRAEYAIDGDPNTLWHTEWRDTLDSTFPHWIEIDMGAVYDVSGFTYLPRQDSSLNGMIHDYKFYVGNGPDCDNVVWVEVASGAFDDSLSKDEKRVCFTITTGRFVRLDAISEVNGGPWTSAAELNVLGELIAELPDGEIDLPEEDPADPLMIITAGDTVEFAGTGYGDPELTYLWNFGDPDIPVSNQQNPGSVQFNTPGTYTVTFTVCNSNGCDPTPDTRTIIVECHDPIPQDNLSVCDFCSEETVGEGPDNGRAEDAIDGDPNTFWVTEWRDTVDSTFPHWIEIDMGNVYNVSGFTYLPRQDSSVNGTIHDYKFYVGNGSDCNNVEWAEVASGAFDDSLSKEEKRVFFTVATGRFVRLEAISEVNGRPWTSVAELKVLGEPGVMPPG